MAGKPETWAGDIAGEFEGVRFGDERLSARVLRIASAVAQRPDVGFPQIFETESQTEAFYRFVNNERVSLKSVLGGHVEQTAARAAEQGLVLVAHDTTEANYSTPREGLGRTGTSNAGFLAHVSLAISTTSDRLPLGVVAARDYARTGKQKKRTGSVVRRADPTRESLRWLEQVAEVEALRSERFEAIHVMDREADIFELVSWAVEHGARFVIRAAQDRRVIDEDDELGRLSEQLAYLEPSMVREVQLGSRALGLTPTQRARHPARSPRIALIGLAGIRVTLRRPPGRSGPEEVTINVVRAWEKDAPMGEPPVSWVLLTTEPIDTAAHLEAIVDWYRARWTIEEYFKALKTGCALEKRQLESYGALSATLGLFIPIAWRLLVLRTLERARPDAPASAVLNDVQLQIVASKAKKGPVGSLTIAQALLSIAAMGGHLKHNGAPGWQTLWRGYEKLLLLEEGWRCAATAAQERCDQS